MRDEESRGAWCLRSYMKKDIREDFMILIAILLKKEGYDLYIRWSHLLSGSEFPVGSGWKEGEPKGWSKGNLKMS